MTATPDGRGVEKPIGANFPADDTRASIEAELVEKLTDLPPAKRAEVITVVRQVVEHHSGPLPPPRMLAEYESILPGLAERIIAMSEEDMAHNQNLQRTALRAEVRERLFGQVGSTLVILAALGVSAWIVVSGYPVTGGLLGGGTLLGVIAVLIGGKDYLLSRLEPKQSPEKQKTASGRGKKRR